MKENHFRLDSEWELMKTPSQTLLIIVINICLAGEKMKESEGKLQASDLKTLIPKFLKREKRKGAEGERVERLRNENGIEGLAEIWVFLDGQNLGTVIRYNSLGFSVKFKPRIIA